MVVEVLHIWLIKVTWTLVAGGLSWLVVFRAYILCDDTPRIADGFMSMSCVPLIWPTRAALTRWIGVICHRYEDCGEVASVRGYRVAPPANAALTYRLAVRAATEAHKALLR